MTRDIFDIKADDDLYPKYEITWPWSKNPQPKAKVEPSLDSGSFQQAGALLTSMRQDANPLVKAFANKAVKSFATFVKGKTQQQVLEFLNAKKAELQKFSKGMSAEQLQTLAASIAASDPATIKQAMSSLKPAATKGQAIQAISGYMNNWAKAIQSEPDKNKKIALAKEIVNFLADRKDSAATTSAIPSAISIIKRANLGNFQNTLINALKTGSPMSEGIKLAQKLLDHVELTWEDLDMQLHLNESSNQYVVNDIDLLAQIRTQLKLS